MTPTAATSATADTRATPRSLAPIDLHETSAFVLEALWRVLCDGCADTWLADIGRAGRGQPDFETACARWSEALAAQRRDPARGAVAARVLARLQEHAAEVARNRRIYSHTTPAEIRHRYWPTGARAHLDRKNLFTMSFCPQPDRFITSTTKIASAGSCFAHEIGRALRAWRYNYFITEPGPDHLSDEERWRQRYGQFSARYGLIFNAPSLRQLVERGLGLLKLEPYIWQQEGVWRDPYRDALTFESPEAYAADVPIFEAALTRTLLEAEVFILTLGVNEVWYFKNDGTYLSRVPWRLMPALLGRKALTVEDNLAELQRLHDAWMPFNPELRIIVTVSPVPLLATFRSDEANVVVANCHSKSVLRVAAESFADANDNVTYFPAYEAVLYGSRVPFRADGRHVHPDAVQRVVAMFRETFCVPE
ncbi:MAG: GSCFA domain-containing protein [Planctomycetota bacterium]|jgi:hypothetical protein